MKEYNIFPKGCVVDSKYYNAGMKCEGLQVYDIEQIDLDNSEIYIGFEDIRRAREVVETYEKERYSCSSCRRTVEI